MATSENPDWTQTFGQLARSAAVELGVIGLGDELEDSEEEEMRTRFNSMLAKWSRDMNMWREASATITIAGGSGAALLPSEVKDIRTVRHIQSATSKRPLQVFNRDEYYRLPNRTQAGNPIAFYYSQALGGDRLYVWPVPAANANFELDYNRQFYFVEGPEQELDIPPEWHEAALYGLASRSAAMFGTTRTDPAAVQRCDGQARSSYDDLLDKDRPDSYYFEYSHPVEAGG